MLIEELKRFVDEVTDWYWSFNSQRDASWRLSSNWLNRLYACRKTIADMTLLGERPTVGVWGPSQAGKSSMLTTNLDLSNDDIQGVNSALTWDPAHPCRFRGTERTENVENAQGMLVQHVVESTNVTLNPYHGGGDATGCVTRYVLRDRDSVQHIDYPVEIRLASRKALIHALAAGYLTECIRTTEDGNTRFLDENDITDVLERRDTCGTDGKSLLVNVDNGVPVRGNYELLREVCEVVRQLIGIHDARYQNLSSSWNGLTTRILTEKCLLASNNNVRRFMCWLLWENKLKLNELFNDLDAFLGDFHRQHAGKRLFCTLEVASVLVDIAAYEWLNADQTAGENRLKMEETVARTARLIRGLKYRDDGKDILISSGDGNGMALFDHQEKDFGYFQACVLELVVPIHLDDRMSERFKAFIQKADFLDFPGVARQAAELTDGGTRIDLDQLPDNERYRLLTQLMKRGRTASIVSSYAEIGDIDSFVLTVRSATPVNNAVQLINGIRQWWRYEDGSYNGKGRPPMPLFLALTFCATIINDVTAAHGQLPNGGLEAQFHWLEALDELSRPDVARLLLTTFKNRNLPGGDINNYEGMPIRDPNNPELNAAIDAISNDVSFRRLFGNPDSKSFRTFLEMCQSQDGGVNYLFEQIASAVNQGRKDSFRESKCKEIKKELGLLIGEALPSGADEDTSRSQFLQNLASKIGQATQSALSPMAARLGFATQPAWVSYLIRSLQSVSTKQIPRFSSGMDMTAYIADVVNSLATQLDDRSKEVEESWYQDIGLSDSTELLKLYHYLTGRRLSLPDNTEYSIAECISMWCLSYNIAGLPADTIAHELSVVIENVVWHGYEPIFETVVIQNTEMPGIGFRSTTDYQELNVNQAIKTIEDMNRVTIIHALNHNSPSPHETAIIQPFMDFLMRVANGHGANGRGHQTGDDELGLIVERCPNVFE